MFQYIKEFSHLRVFKLCLTKNCLLLLNISESQKTEFNIKVFVLFYIKLFRLNQ